MGRTKGSKNHPKGENAIVVKSIVVKSPNSVVKTGKRGRPAGSKNRVKILSNQEKFQKIGKMGKRKANKAIENMAIEKINKQVRRKNNTNMHSSVGEAVTSQVVSYGDIIAGPGFVPKMPLVEKRKQVEKETPKLSILDAIKNKLHKKGFNWKESSFKILEKNEEFAYWRVSFKDEVKGDVIYCSDIKEYRENEKIK